MELKNVKVTDLRRHPQNPRIHPESALKKLVTSIQTYGWTNPVLVSKDGYLLAGHARCKAAEMAGITEVPAIFLDLDGDKANAYLIADNRLQEETEWDVPLLTDLLKDLEFSGFDLSLTGFDVVEISDLFGDLPADEIEEDDFDADKDAGDIQEPVSKHGDLYELENHRLLCGDATKLEDVRRLMNGREAAMVFTDPPYNVDYTGGTEDKLKIQNDKMSDADFYNFLLKSYTNMLDAVAPGGAIYVCHADTEGLNFRKAMKDAGWLLKQCLIWVKNSLVLGRQDYNWRHEPILYGWKPGAAHTWNSDRKQTTVWEFDKPTRNADHPTMKPIGIPSQAIENSSKCGDIVLDLFGGSGSTLIAAEQTGRICYTMELDPKYADVIVKRYYHNFPESEIKLNGNPVNPELLFKDF